jgi:predicted nucleotidyltransferase
MLEMTVAQHISDHFESSDVPGVVSVFLFGSHAEDRAHRESDIDVGILFDREAVATRRERFDASVRLAADLQTVLTIEVDVVVLNDSPPLLGRRIVTEGQRVYCSNEEADHAFVRDVQLRAADLQPFLERMREIKLQALAPR